MIIIALYMRHFFVVVVYEGARQVVGQAALSPVHRRQFEPLLALWFVCVCVCVCVCFVKWHNSTFVLNLCFCPFFFRCSNAAKTDMSEMDKLVITFDRSMARAENYLVQSCWELGRR